MGQHMLILSDEKTNNECYVGSNVMIRKLQKCCQMYFEKVKDNEALIWLLTSILRTGGIPNWCTGKTKNECRLPEVRTEIVLTNGVLTRQAWWVVTYKDVKSTKGMNEWIFFLDGRQEEAAQVQRFKICIWSTFLGLNCDFWKTTSSNFAAKSHGRVWGVQRIVLACCFVGCPLCLEMSTSNI